MDPALLRCGLLYLPLLATLCMARAKAPSQRMCAGCALALLWNLLALLPLNLWALERGWWSFGAEGGAFLGLPVDLWLGWALLWGAVAPLLARFTGDGACLLLLLALDLALMPRCAPLVALHPGWLRGELLALLGCALPGLLLARWTSANTCLRGRAGLQGAGFGLLVVVLVPLLALSAEGREPGELVAALTSRGGCGLQLVALTLVPGAAAIQELARSGQGTPVPFDPTRQLVKRGPYAYVRNPMQVSAVLTLLAIAILLQSPWTVWGVLVALIYSASYANGQERRSLQARFGSSVRAYRKRVRSWWPHLRPPARESCARLWVARSCGPCPKLERWLRARAPRGLEFRAAEEHPLGMPQRLTYESTQGDLQLTGVRALAAALQHLNLAWGLCGMGLGLPLVAEIFQVLGDALGYGPRRRVRPAPKV